jgi:cyanophycinase
LRKTGAILLQGGAEFGGRMADSDLHAIHMAGGFDAPISIIPAAAAPDNNHKRAGQNGVRWFESLGARNVELLPLIDRNSAEDPSVIEALGRSRLVYLLGGFPLHLGQCLAGSSAWKTILEAWKNGAVIAGSSAGAMVLCSRYFDPQGDRIVQGLGLLANACVLPHHDTFGQAWAMRLGQELPGTLLIGIDEQTGMTGSVDDDPWRVLGKGQVTLYKNTAVYEYPSGARFQLPD